MDSPLVTKDFGHFSLKAQKIQTLNMESIHWKAFAVSHQLIIVFL